MFRFKQFNVDQTGCAMKINTDGVLLGALAGAGNPKTILDIGTGTGVIALMLAQRFPEAIIDGVEIDEKAAKTAKNNFANSPFADRLTLYGDSFERFFEDNPDRRYDLIISNPPFYINSLKSPGAGKQLAKHADDGFFESLLTGVAEHLSEDGLLWLILPIETAELVEALAAKMGLHLQDVIEIRSFVDSAPHRQILTFGLSQTILCGSELVIYDEPKLYSMQYRAALTYFFTIF